MTHSLPINHHSYFLYDTQYDFFPKTRTPSSCCYNTLDFSKTLTSRHFYYETSLQWQKNFRELYSIQYTQPKQNKKHTALTIPVWSPTTVLGKPNPAWLRSSDGIRYIQGGMTVWYKHYFYNALMHAKNYTCPFIDMYGATYMSINGHVRYWRIAKIAVWWMYHNIISSQLISSKFASNFEVNFEVIFE